MQKTTQKWWFSQAFNLFFTCWGVIEQPSQRSCFCFVPTPNQEKVGETHLSRAKLLDEVQTGGILFFFFFSMRCMTHLTKERVVL